MAVNNKDFLVKNGLQVGGNTQITGSLTAAGLVYPVSDGDFKNAIVTDGSGNLSFESVDTVESDVTNNTGSLIPKGTPVYQTGSAGNTLTIAPSDAANAATMPAIGVAGSDIADGQTGRVIHFGYIRGVDTSAFSEGSRIYVADGGGYQEGRPTGETHIVQFLGVVTKVHASNGSGVVFGGGRALDVPNLDDGNIFIGDNTNSPVTATLDTDLVPEATNQYFTNARAISAVEGAAHLTIDGGTLYVDTSNNYIGINDTSPNHALDVTGSIGIAGTEVIDSGGEVVTARLKDSGVTSGTYGSASAVPVLTIDAKGRVTSASSTAVAGVSSTAYNTSTGVLTINTSNGGSFTEDLGVGTADSPTFAGLTIDTNTLFVDAANNRVGIGTTSPDAKLDIEGNFEQNYALKFTNTMGTGVVSGFRSHGVNGESLSLYHDGDRRQMWNSDGSVTFENGDGNDQMYISATGNVGIGTSSIGTNEKLLVKTSTDSSVNQGLVIQRSLNSDQGYINYQGGSFQFRSTDGDPLTFGQVSNIRMRINPDGNVGIGTASPGGLLDVQTAANRYLRVRSANADLELLSDNNTNPVFRIQGTGTADLVNIYDNTNEVFTILDGGNVGIGTASPAEKLQVDAGNIHVGGVTSSTPLTSGSQYKIKMGQQYWNGTKGTDSSIKLELYSVSSSDTYGLGVSSSELEIQSQADIGFYAGGGTTRTKRMHIEGTNGNVGIGTTGPSSKLQVNGSITVESTGQLNVRYDGSDSYRSTLDWNYLQLGNNGGNSIVAGRTNTGGYLRFFVNNTNDVSSGINGTEAMRIHNSGRISMGAAYTGTTGWLSVSSGSAYPQYLQSTQRYMLGMRNTSVDANYIWLTHDTRNSQSSMAIHFNGIGDKFYFEENGDFTAGGDITSNSDRRLKSDIKPISNALQTVQALSGRAYIKDDKANIGLIAQEVEEVIPFMVKTADDEMGTKSVNYQNMVALLIEAVKEQQEQIDELKRMLENS